MRHREKRRAKNAAKNRAKHAAEDRAKNAAMNEATRAIGTRDAPPTRKGGRPDSGMTQACRASRYASSRARVGRRCGGGPA